MKSLFKTFVLIALAVVLAGCNTDVTNINYEMFSIKTDFKLSHISPSLFTDEALYFMCFTEPYEDRNPLDKDYHTIRERFFKMDFSGNTMQLFGFDHTNLIEVVALFEGNDQNLYITKAVQLGIDIDEHVERTLLKLDPNGAVAQELPLLNDNRFFQVVAKGNEYVCNDGGRIVICDSKFQKIAEILTGIEYGNTVNIFSINDSRIVCAVEKEHNLHILTIDRENRRVEESFLIENAYNAYEGNSEYDIIYYNQDERKIYAQNLVGLPKELVSLTDYGLENVGITNIKLTESGDVVIVCDVDAWPDGTTSKSGQSDVVILKKQ